MLFCGEMKDFRSAEDVEMERGIRQGSTEDDDAVRTLMLQQPLNEYVRLKFRAFRSDEQPNEQPA